MVIQRATRATGIPAPTSLRKWALAARGKKKGAITLRIVNEAESHALNQQYRGKDKPTNVLSFTPHPSPLTPHALGDLVICAPVVAREAREQKKVARAHWAHMVVHGCLHLLGHDHENDTEAERMDAREVRILKELGFENPYLND